VFPPSGYRLPLPDAKWEYEINETIHPVDEQQLKEVIPTPSKSTFHGTKLTLSEGLMIHYREGLENEAEQMAASLAILMGEKPTVMNSTAIGPNIISLKAAPLDINTDSDEAYSIEADPEKGVIITGKNASGVFYGIQTLLASLPVEVFEKPSPRIELESLSILDAPEFAYRGMHLDLSRNFIRKESILKLIDIMAFYKMNRLQLHLTDDEGWRLEIEELPELTSVGAYRGHTLDDREYLQPSYGSGPFPDPERSHGSGYLSREDFKEILRFAWEHHIGVIPEINMPGHSRAAIKSMEARYGRLMEEGKEEEAKKYRISDPLDSSDYYSAQGFTDNVVCVCDDAVYRFYETVVDDIIEMYRESEVPLHMIHTGGDEVPSGAWEKSPACVQFLEDNPSVGNARNLQAYFFGRIVEILTERNLEIGGWEEVVMKLLDQGGWIPNPEFTGKQVFPYVWNSQGNYIDLGYRLANAGYPVILCNVSNFYFDLAYNHHPEEPGHTWGGFVNTRSAFDFIPYDLYKSVFLDSRGRPIDADEEYKEKERLHPGSRRNVVGLQGELWSETIKGQDTLEYYYLPKLIGLAERAWSGHVGWETIASPEERKRAMDEDWNVFANKVGTRELPRLDYLFGGFNYRIPPPGAVIREGELWTNTLFPGLTIRYTTDGSEPDETSPRYEGPVPVTGTVKLKAFNKPGRSSRATVIDAGQ
jgi:hexosaminidase